VRIKIGEDISQKYYLIELIDEYIELSAYDGQYIMKMMFRAIFSKDEPQN
jgi:hypothetical protein